MKLARWLRGERNGSLRSSLACLSINTIGHLVSKSNAQMCKEYRVRRRAKTEGNEAVKIDDKPERINDRITCSETMPLEFVSNIVVKEEYMVNESDLDFYDLPATEEAKIKCGEIFVGSTGCDFTFVCTQCLKSFLDLLSFGEHIQDGHPHHKNEIHEPVVLQDDIPPLKAETPEEVKRDSQPKNDEDDAKDELISQKSSTNSEEYEEPVRDKKSMSPKRIKQKSRTTYCCFSCGLIFVNFGRYRNHYRTEHPEMIEKDDTGSSRPEKFVPKVPEEMLCKYCLKTFSEPASFHGHMANDHLIKIYSCLLCPKTFSNRNPRDWHVNAHMGRRPHQCPHCPKKFSHPNNLQTHIKIHLNIKAYSCEYCNKKYVTHSDLTIHRRIHTKEKPFQCDECGMAFIAQVQLTIHKRRHRNIKNHKCPYCEKAFFHSTAQKRHITTHTRERPFSCDICNKQFRTPGALRSHKLLHSDEKKYECKLCDKSFAQHAGLYSHMKSHREIN